VRASQTLLTIGQFCDPLAVWAFQVIPVNQNIEMANSPQIYLNRLLGKQLT